MTLGFLTQAIGRCHSLREQEVGVEVSVSDDVWFATVELNILVERGSKETKGQILDFLSSHLP